MTVANRTPDRATRAIVFDFDGTLIDTMQSFADTAGDVLATRYAVTHAWARRRYLETSGVPFFQQLEVLFPGDSRNEDASVEFEQRKLRAFFDETFEPSVRETLGWLRRAGYFVAVSSNNFQHLIDEFVAREPVEFDAVLGCRENFFKGHHHFTDLQQRLGVSAQQILFVGDSLMDAVRASESGVRFVARTGTFTSEAFATAHPGTPTVAHIAELPALLPTL